MWFWLQIALDALGFYYGRRVAWPHWSALRKRLAVFDPAVRLERKGLNEARGVIQGVRFQMEVSAVSQREVRQKMRIGSAAWLPPSVRFEPSATLTLLAQEHSGYMLTGDPRFDATVLVEGPAWRVLAAFDGRTRALVRKLTERGVRMEDGSLHLECSDQTPEQTARTLRDLSVAVERLGRAFRANPEERLRRLLESDRYPRVRARALRALVDSSPHGMDTEHAVRAALDDPMGIVRLEAARTAPVGAAREVILSLCRGVQREAIRTEALALAGERLDPADALPLLREHVRDPSERIRAAARDALLRMGADHAEGAVSVVPIRGGEVSVTNEGGEVSLAGTGSEEEPS